MNNPRIKSLLDSLLNRNVKVRFRDGVEIEGIFFDYNFTPPFIIVVRRNNGEYVLCNFASINLIEEVKK